MIQNNNENIVFNILVLNDKNLLVFTNELHDSNFVVMFLKEYSEYLLLLQYTV